MKKVKFQFDGRKARLLSEKHSDAMKEFFSYSHPGARFMPGYGEWDGRVHMMQRNTVSVGLLRGLKDELKKDGWKPKVTKWKNRPRVPQANHGIVIKDEKYAYQRECVNKMLAAISWGGGIVLSATGTGKTAMASMFTSWTKGNVLFVVDTLDLMNQAKKEIEYWWKKNKRVERKVGIVGKQKFFPERVTSATIQTLHAHIDDPKFLEWFKKVDIVIIDEVHVQMNRRNFSVMNIIKPQAIFGLTATLQLRKKPTRLKAYSICGPVIFEFPLKEAVEQGVLSRGCALQVRVNSDPVLEELRPNWYYSPRVPDIQKQNLDYKWNVTRNTYTNSAIVELVRQAIKKGYYVAVIVERVRHLAILKKSFEKLKLNPQIVFGEASTEARERRKERFEKGKASRLLLSTKVFAKGVNIKRLDMAIDAAQQSNKDGTQQKYGRCVRLHSDKKGVLYFDIVSAMSKLPTRKGAKLPRTEKAAKSRYQALKKLSVPTQVITYSNAKEALKAAETLLHKSLKDGKRHG